MRCYSEAYRAQLHRAQFDFLLNFYRLLVFLSTFLIYEISRKQFSGNRSRDTENAGKDTRRDTKTQAKTRGTEGLTPDPTITINSTISTARGIFYFYMYFFSHKKFQFNEASCAASKFHTSPLTTLEGEQDNLMLAFCSAIFFYLRLFYMRTMIFSKFLVIFRKFLLIFNKFLMILINL